MSQKNPEVLDPRTGQQSNRSLRQAVPARPAAPAPRRRLALVAALVLALGIALPVLATREPARSLLSGGADARPSVAPSGSVSDSDVSTDDVATGVPPAGAVQGTETYQPGPLAGYADPEVWEAAEAGYYGRSASQPANQRPDPNTFYPEAPDYVPGVSDVERSDYYGLGEGSSSAGPASPAAGYEGVQYGDGSDPSQPTFPW